MGPFEEFKGFFYLNANNSYCDRAQRAPQWNLQKKYFHSNKLCCYNVDEALSDSY